MSDPLEPILERQEPRGASTTLASRWVLALAIAGSALAVGTTHTITLCVVTGVLAVAVVLAWWGAEPMRPRSGATLLLMTGIALTVYTALQCVPIPIGWLAAIAPYNADVWSRALSPLHDPGPAWAPISLDPSATRVEVLKGTAYLLTFMTALRVARRKDGVSFLAMVVVATGVTLAIAALLHPAFGAKSLFGIYEPGPGIAERHIAPLMNPNNLAGYLNVALCLALAAAVSPEPKVPRPITAAVVLFLGAAQIWVASRAGVLTMGLGAVIVVTVVRAARSRRPVAIVSLVVGAAAAAGATLVVLGASQEASDELLDSDASKAGLIWRVMRMLPAMPWFGCGGGAFESAFPAFRVEPGYESFVYPENFVVQWLAEWGFPVGIAGLAAVAIALRPSAVLARSTTAIGAWAAIVALAVQNLADVGSNIPGLVLSGVACAAIVTGGTDGRASSRRIERWALRPKYAAAIAGAAALCTMALALETLSTDLNGDRRRMYEAATNKDVSAKDMHVLARASMLRHPGEPYLPFVTALRASRARDDSPMPWLGATLERAHVYGPAHLVLARMLATRSPSQARLEYRLAMEQMPENAWLTLQEVSRLVGSRDDAMELVPSGKVGVTVLGFISQNVGDRLPATQAQLDLELMQRAPDDSGAALRIARRAVEDVEKDGQAPWCEGSGRDACLRIALDSSVHAQLLTVGRCEGSALVARAQLAAGDSRKPLDVLERQADDVSDRVPCLQTLTSIATREGDEARVQRTLDKVANAGCNDDRACAAQLAWVAAREEERAHLRKALALYRRAADRAPDDDEILEAMARLAAATGLHAEAAQDYERLARRRPDVTRWRVSATAEWASAVRGSTGP